MHQFNKYLQQKQVEIGKSIRNHKIIYLDTNYWIKLRNQAKKENSEDRVLFDKLTDLVESNRCIIPVSEITFYEILKQSDINSLKDSANLIDNLSKGISIISESERRHLEFVNFVREKTGGTMLNLQEAVWTKLSLNILYKVFLKYDSNMLSNEFIDFLSNISFEKMIIQLQSTGNLTPFKFKDDVDALNIAKEKYKTENKTFNEMYLSELGGYLEVFETDLNDSMEYVFFLDYGRFPTDKEKENINPRHCRNMIYNLSKYNKLNNELPSFRIFPELNSSIRWNKDRKYKDGNDTLDFLHTSSALPYFDFFFTERELKTIIVQQKLDKLYNCKVESKETEILKIIDSI